MPVGKSAAGKRPTGRRGGGPQALAVSLAPIAEATLGKRSRAERSLILDWPSIVGNDVAQLCHPLTLAFERRSERLDGTLALRIRGAHATRVQHLEPLVIERVNGYLGYRAVARLRLQSDPAPAKAEAPDDGVDDGVDDSADDSAPAAAPAQRRPGAAIADPGLAAALERLRRTLRQP